MEASGRRSPRTRGIKLADAAGHVLWMTKVLRPDRAGAFRRDDARNLLRRTLESYVARYGLVVHAWSVEPSRAHVVFDVPPDADPREALGDLFGYYTRRFNARYRHTGALFRTKFLWRVVDGPLALADAVRRVHEAPSPDDPGKPGQEPWSSRDVYEGGRADGIVLLEGRSQRLPAVIALAGQ